MYSMTSANGQQTKAAVMTSQQQLQNYDLQGLSLSINIYLPCGGISLEFAQKRGGCTVSVKTGGMEEWVGGMFT